MMQIYFCFMVVWVASSYPTQSLNIRHVTASDTLFEFTMINQQHLDLQDIVSEGGLFSRSLLENLHGHAGVRQAYISITAGRMNQGIANNAPTHGTLLITNSDVEQEIMVSQLSEVFRTTRVNTQSNPAYFMNIESKDLQYEPIGFKLNFTPGRLLYAQDPTDVICIDGIQNIKLYMGCESKRGLFAIIDQNKIFQSSYLSVQAYFEWDELTRTATQQIVILALMPSAEIANIFKGQAIKSCTTFSRATIQHSLRTSIFDLQKAQSVGMNMLSRQATDQQYNITQSKQIIIKNYLSGEWFSFQSHYNQWIQVLQDGTLQFQVYFQSDFVPLFSSMQCYAESENGERVHDVNITKTLEFSAHFKMITISAQLQRDTYLFFSIKFDKKLKSFEEYPHDPDRGHDIISFPIKFTPTNTNITNLYFTENQVTRLPAPDFSMPFNVLTYSCLTLGYYFLIIFRLSVDRFEFDKKEKGSLLQRVIGLVWQLLKSAK